MRNILGSPYLSVIPTHIINNSPFDSTNIIIQNHNSNTLHPLFYHARWILRHTRLDWA